MPSNDGGETVSGENVKDFARGGVQSLDAALPVLRVLARLPGPCSLSNLAS